MPLLITSLYSTDLVLIDEIELTEGGIKSRKSTASSERLLAQIEILQSLPEGTIIPNAPSIRVQAIEKQGDKTVSSQTVLSTDEQGRITKNVLSPSPQKTGTQVINEQLSLLKDPKVVKYLDNLIESRVNQKINQTVDPAFLEAQSQREQEPNNPKWWQQFLKKGGDFFKHWQQQYQQQQVAKKLYYLFTQKVQFGQSRYAQNGYTLVRQPIGQQDRYTVFNANNQPILTFDVGRQKRLSIIDAQLSIDDSKALLNLEKSKTNLTQNNQTLSLLMTRANNLAAQLVEMAQRQQQSIRRTGDSYTLAIDPNGDVEISANDGRGVIYHQTLQGNKPNATNLMTEADLTFFERQFPPSQQTSQTPVSTITQNVAPTRRSRHR